jgi:hypothetical protein
VCLVCGTDQDIDIDHVQAKGMGGSKERDVPENKSPLCRGHHDAKHRHVLETRVKDGFFEWRKAKGVWIKVPVEVSKRYKCLVQKEVMPDATTRSPNVGQRVEEGEEAGRLSDGAEAALAVRPMPNTAAHRGSSAPSLSKEESDEERQGSASNPEGLPAGAETGPARDVGGGDGGELHVAPDSAGDSSASSPLTHEQRVAIAQQIHDTEWNRQWIAGDTANAWRAELGEEAEQYICDFGYVHESMANIMYVCEAVPKNMRRTGLRFSHHVVMLGLNREDMEMWLDKCEEEQWSVAEFRRQVKGTKPKVKRWTLEELWQKAREFGIAEWPEIGQFLEGLEEQG